MRKIVIIDDDEIYSENLEYLLNNKGFDVKRFDSTKSIFNDLKEYNPNLLLCDINFLEGISNEFINNLRKDKFFNNTPIVVISGDCTIDEIELLDIGVSEIFYKPLPFQIALRVINRLINKQSGYYLTSKLFSVIFIFPMFIFKFLAKVSSN